MAKEIKTEGLNQRMLALGEALSPYLRSKTADVYDLTDVVDRICGQGRVGHDFLGLLSKALDLLQEKGVAISFYSENGQIDRPYQGSDSVEPLPPDLFDVPIEDSLGRYFREIIETPLLDRRQEVILAIQVEEGRRANEILASEGVFEKDEAELVRIEENGMKAQRHLIKANTRLCVSVAKRYRNKGLPFLDLIGEGNLGLIRATEKYDWRSGNRFSTYAVWWIRQAITKALESQVRAIRLPSHSAYDLRKVFDARNELNRVNGEKPSLEEIAKEVGMLPDKVRSILSFNYQIYSLDSPAGRESEDSLEETLADLSAIDPESRVSDIILIEKLYTLISDLTPREAQILRLRFGLLDGKEHTLRQLGTEFGLSRERIRQIEKEALGKLSKRLR